MYSQGYIDAAEEGFDNTIDLGHSITAKQDETSEEVASKVDNLQVKWAEMNELWDKKKVDYDQCMQLQMFNRDIEQMEVVMVQQEVRIY